MNEHPTQSLLDLFTMREQLGTLEGLKVAIVGDISHSRVARSNIWALQKLGSEVRVAGPGSMMPVLLNRTGAKVCGSVAEACTDADIVMGLRLQIERMDNGLFPSVAEYAFYALPTKYECAKPHIIMPGHIITEWKCPALCVTVIVPKSMLSRRKACQWQFVFIECCREIIWQKFSAVRYI